MSAPSTLAAKAIGALGRNELGRYETTANVSRLDPMRRLIVAGVFVGRWVRLTYSQTRNADAAREAEGEVISVASGPYGGSADYIVLRHNGDLAVTLTTVLRIEELRRP